jgi:hypothetical protein
MSAVREVAKGSTLTEAQVDSLLLHRMVKAGQITLREAAELRKPFPVRIGALYRVVQQARENIRGSLLTLVVAIWLGYVKIEDVRRLFELVARGAETLPEDQAVEMVGVIEALVRKVVM